MFFIYVLQIRDDTQAENYLTSALRLAVAAALLTVIQHVLGPARLAASFSGVLDGSLQFFYLESDAGIARGVRLAGVLAIITGLMTKKRWIAVAGAIIACLSFTMMGHTVTHTPRWILALFLAIHVSVVAFWFGALRPLRRYSADSRAEFALRLEIFSRVAARAVPVIFVAGLGLAILLLGDFAKLATPYGFMIIGKVSGFALLLGLASLNRWRLLPKIRSGHAPAIATFRTIAAIEWLIIAAIIISTTSLTSLFSP